MSPVRRPLDARAADRGAALVTVLLITLLLHVAGAGLVALSMTERLIAAHHRVGVGAGYAAAAVVDRAIDDLQQMADWTPAAAGLVRSTFAGSTSTPTTPWGQTLDLTALTAALQTASDAVARRGPDNPQWRLFADGPIEALLPPGAVAEAYYVVAWVADDVAESDGSPSVDTNKLIAVRGLALGPGRTTRAVAATLAAVEDPFFNRTGARLLSWREIR